MKLLAIRLARWVVCFCCIPFALICIVGGCLVEALEAWELNLTGYRVPPLNFQEFPYRSVPANDDAVIQDNDADWWKNGERPPWEGE